MRGYLPVIAVSVAALSASGAGVIRADAACSGDACGVLRMAGDGCVWTNKGTKSVRLLLVAGETARVVTVLAPGASFKEADKAYCVTAGGDRRVEASFAALKKMPEDGAPAVKAATPLPRAKPAVAAAPATGEVVVASVGARVPSPRAKPEPSRVASPLPRAKPEETPAATAVAPVAAVAPSAPTQGASALACDNDCPPILFKVIDNCLWVLNLNPRPVAFEAEAGGRQRSVMLEAADGTKADERAAALGGATPPKDEAAVHMRLKDPFQTAGSGIPVYRARLGGADSCVKSRAEITRFSARYTQ